MAPGSARRRVPSSIEWVLTTGRLPASRMTKNTWTLIAVAVVLAALYVFQFADFRSRPRIQINVSSRPFMPNAGPDDVLPILFGFDRDLAITALRVTPLSLLTNRTAGSPEPKPVWQLRARAASEPVRGFRYGEPIGQTEVVSGPEKLIPSIGYRLEIEAGKLQGSVDFVPQAALSPGN